MTNESERFAAAYVATSYLLERRGEQLMEGLAPAQRTVALVAELSREDKTKRAHALAGELARIVRALEKRRLT
jgi:hypothetical protein